MVNMDLIFLKNYKYFNVYISSETPEQTENRLRKVIQTSELKIYDVEYFFKECSIEKFVLDVRALAIVRDEEVWSFLIPSESSETENFKLFSFHFKDGLDNSGFVGWLASTIKRELGTGVFVVCGQNTRRGGIFDYWGCPVSIADDVLRLVRKLRE
jgi:hypothetical protein